MVFGRDNKKTEEAKGVKIEPKAELPVEPQAPSFEVLQQQIAGLENDTRTALEGYLMSLRDLERRLESEKADRSEAVNQLSELVEAKPSRESIMRDVEEIASARVEELRAKGLELGEVQEAEGFEARFRKGELSLEDKKFLDTEVAPDVLTRAEEAGYVTMAQPIGEEEEEPTEEEAAAEQESEAVTEPTLFHDVMPFEGGVWNPDRNRYEKFVMPPPKQEG